MTNEKPNAKSLAARLQSETAAKVSELEIKAANTSRLAAAYDAHGYAGPLPWIVRADAKPAYDGDLGTLHYRDVAPDELRALLEAFEPIPRKEFKSRGSRSFRPGELPADAAEVRECDGLEITVSGSQHGRQLRASWSAMVGDIQTGFYVDVRPVHFLHPYTSRRAVTVANQFVRYEGATSLNWPDKGALYNSVAGDAALFVRMYGGSDQSHADCHIRGGDVLALVRAWEDEANKRGEATRAAFEEAFKSAQALGLPSADDIRAQADKMRDDYAKQKTRAGTLEQAATLQTPHALADKAIAEKHWKPYADRFGIENSRDYFEHYAWACAYLDRCGMLSVPVTDEMREQATGGIPADWTAYRYGTRWL